MPPPSPRWPAPAPSLARAPRRLLGIDEAGRGCVIGPLVVGGFLTEESRLAELASAGVRDSKLLSPRRREHLYTVLAAMGTPFTVALPPSRIDVAVSRHGLNRLEAEAFAEVVRAARAELTYVDACDPVAPRFGRLVGELAGCPDQVRASHHADRDNPLVAAASIVAKVTRDRAIARLRRRIGREVGSGYPSDPRTIEYLREALSARGSRASWIRHSWRTAERLKPPAPILPLERFTP